MARHRVTTSNGDEVITRSGAEYAIAHYGAFGPVRKVQCVNGQHCGMCRADN